MAAKDLLLVMIAGEILLISIADKRFDIALDWIGNSEFETGDQVFNDDFPIMSCYKYGSLS
ncbi:hypothetical protein G9A89_008799 [Geosiphon pyriformis]|nr:hypothetical protein G9A89_008799 [Geosiphon pyriformis]